MTSDRSENIKIIGVIGAGQMGSGIAHVCALAGYHVKLSDVEATRLDNAVQLIDHNLARQVGRGRVSDDRPGRGDPAHQDRHGLRDVRRLRRRHRGGHREAKKSSARSSRS